MEGENAGRGRGRGRGGVPVLPQGMWDALQSNSDKPTAEAEIVAEDVQNDNQKQQQYEDVREDSFAMPIGFGRGRGGGRGDFGRGGGRGGGRGRGGLERDVKGKDWDCPSCTNVNWSWRTTCNKCGTQKPASAFAENESRDGAAGGFNERQDRMSAATVEIDEEGFDDFGRRVKKDARADRRAKEEAALARLQEKYKHLLPSSIDGEGNGADEATPKAPVSTAAVAAAPLRNEPARDVPASSRSNRDNSRDRRTNDATRYGTGSGSNTNSSNRPDNDPRDRREIPDRDRRTYGEYSNNGGGGGDRRREDGRYENSRDGYRREDTVAGGGRKRERSPDRADRRYGSGGYGSGNGGGDYGNGRDGAGGRRRDY